MPALQIICGVRTPEGLRAVHSVDNKENPRTRPNVENSERIIELRSAHGFAVVGDCAPRSGDSLRVTRSTIATLAVGAERIAPTALAALILSSVVLIWPWLAHKENRRFPQKSQSPSVAPNPRLRIIFGANGGLGTARPRKSGVGRGVPTAPSGPTRPTGSYRYSVVLAQNLGVFILLRKSTGLKN